MFHYSISVFSMHFTINCYRKEWTCITHNKSNRTKNIIKGVRRCGGKRIKKKRSIELKKNKRKQKRGEWKSRAQNEIGVEAGWTETFVSAESNGNGRRENIFIGRMFSFVLYLSSDSMVYWVYFWWKIDCHISVVNSIICVRYCMPLVPAWMKINYNFCSASSTISGIVHVLFYI